MQPQHLTPPLISIIIPVYNVERYLRRCLDSVCGQTYRNLEIICVNDGSTDGSAGILGEYAEKDSRIVVITQKNSGLSAARNTALDAARGEWIMGVDSDDWIEPETCAAAAAAISDDVNIIIYGVEVDGLENDLERKQGMQMFYELKFEGRQIISQSLHCTQTNWNFWGRLFRRSLIEKYGLRQPVGKLYEDVAFFFSYFAIAGTAYYIPKHFYHYVQRPDSIMGVSWGCKTPRGLEVLNQVELYRKFLQKNGLEAEWRPFLYHLLHSSYTQACNFIPPELRKECTTKAYQLAKSYGMHKVSYSVIVCDYKVVHHAKPLRFFHDCRQCVETYGVGRFRPISIAHTREGNILYFRGRRVCRLSGPVNLT